MAPRVITSFNGPLPATLSGLATAEPAVQIDITTVDTVAYPGLGETGPAATLTSMPGSNNNGMYVFASLYELHGDYTY